VSFALRAAHGATPVRPAGMLASPLCRHGLLGALNAIRSSETP
jgi:hypothetical protein